MRRFGLVLLVACLAARPDFAAAQLVPGRQYVMAQIGPFLSECDLLRDTATYPTGRIADPANPVVTDISLDPGMSIGARYGYALTRRLLFEAELNGTLSVNVIRQLEIKPDTQAEDQPQYETTTSDVYIYQYGINLSYWLASWRHAAPYLTFGVSEHVMDIKQKGEVNPDPVRDRAMLAGLGVMLPASDRLGIRVELRDTMYNFRFDNQFVDPVRARQILFQRPDFYNSTSISGTKFQNDLALNIGFMVRIF